MPWFHPSAEGRAGGWPSCLAAAHAAAARRHAAAGYGCPLLVRRREGAQRGRRRRRARGAERRRELPAAESTPGWPSARMAPWRAARAGASTQAPSISSRDGTALSLFHSLTPKRAQVCLLAVHKQRASSQAKSDRLYEETTRDTRATAFHFQAAHRGAPGHRGAGIGGNQARTDSWQNVLRKVALPKLVRPPIRSCSERHPPASAPRAASRCRRLLRCACCSAWRRPVSPRPTRLPASERRAPAPTAPRAPRRRWAGGERASGGAQSVSPHSKPEGGGASGIAGDATSSATSSTAASSSARGSSRGGATACAAAAAAAATA